MTPASALTADDRLRRAPARLRLLSDERLVGRVRAGDERAFEVLFQRHQPGVLSFCRYLLGSRDEAEDAVQQAFLRLHGALRRERPPAELRPFLYAIARNRCRSLLAARRDELPVEHDLPDVAGLADEVQQRAELQQLVADIGRLPEAQRSALVLAELGDLSHAGIAEVLDVPEARVRTLIYQAKAHLLAEREARERSCEDVRVELATASGAALRRGPLKRHLRGCPGCRQFRAAISRQDAALGIVLPVAATAALKGTFGGGGGAAVAAATTAGGAAAGAGAAASGGLLGGVGAIKAAAVVAALGAGAAGGTAAVDAVREDPRPAPKAAPAAIASPAAVTTPAASAVPPVRLRGQSPQSPSTAEKPAATGAPAPAVRLRGRSPESREASRKGARVQRKAARRERKAAVRQERRREQSERKAVRVQQRQERKAAQLQQREERKAARKAPAAAPAPVDETSTTTTAAEPAAPRSQAGRDECRRANSVFCPTSAPAEGGTR